MALTMALSALHAPGTAEDIVAAGDHYVMVDKGVLTLWSETNGEPGLQTAPVVVLGIVIAEPDTHLHL